MDLNLNIKGNYIMDIDVNDRITLSGQEIYEADFKIDAKGYSMQEVDKLLDIVIRDYGEYNNIVRELAIKNSKLEKENDELRTTVRNLKSNLDALKHSEKEVTNVDLIRRVSQLEKIILGKEND